MPLNKKLLSKKIGKNIKEFEENIPMSNGKLIKSKKQAIAISYSEAGENKPLKIKKVPKNGMVKKV